jgi:hypothetical protein
MIFVLKIRCVANPYLSMHLLAPEKAKVARLVEQVLELGKENAELRKLSVGSIIPNSPQNDEAQLQLESKLKDAFDLLFLYQQKISEVQ